jgi:hypothetical protein
MNSWILKRNHNSVNASIIYANSFVDGLDMFRLGVIVTGGKLVRHAACVVRKGFWLVGWMSGS